MSDDDLKELDAIFGGGEVGVDLAGDAPASEPVGTSTATDPRAQAGASPRFQRFGGWGWAAFAFVVTLWCFGSIRSCNWSPIPDGDHVNVDSIHVLLVPAENMTTEQGQAISSTRYRTCAIPRMRSSAAFSSMTICRKRSPSGSSCEIESRIRGDGDRNAKAYISVACRFGQASASRLGGGNTMSRFDINFLIDDSNAHEFAAQVADGVCSSGYIERDYVLRPEGFYAQRFNKQNIYPRSKWPDLAKMQEDNESSPLHFHKRRKVHVLNQNGLPYCWFLRCDRWRDESLCVQGIDPVRICQRPRRQHVARTGRKKAAGVGKQSNTSIDMVSHYRYLARTCI